MPPDAPMTGRVEKGLSIKYSAAPAKMHSVKNMAVVRAPKIFSKNMHKTTPITLLKNRCIQLPWIKAWVTGLMKAVHGHGAPLV